MGAWASRSCGSWAYSLDRAAQNCAAGPRALSTRSAQGGPGVGTSPLAFRGKNVLLSSRAGAETGPGAEEEGPPGVQASTSVLAPGLLSTGSSHQHLPPCPGAEPGQPGLFGHDAGGA